VDPILSYNFAEIDAAVLGDIQSTSVRLRAALDDLSRQIAPLQQAWTRDAAVAYQSEQARWQQAASALHDILVRLGAAVRDGAADVADADRRAAGMWGAG
jgi:WXG100 family type VII secretion target